MPRSASCFALLLGCSALGCSAPAASGTARAGGAAGAPTATSERATPGQPPPTHDPAAPASEATVRVLRFNDGARPRIRSLPSTVVEVPDSASPWYDEAESESYDALTGGPSSYPVVQFPEHAEALNTAIREQSLEIMEDLAQDVRRGATVCRAAIARTDLLVISCSGLALPDRSAPEPWVFSRHYRVDGAELTRFEVRDALLPGTELDDLIRERCRRMAAREDIGDPGPGYCAESAEFARLSFETGGLRVSYQRPMNSYSFEYLRAQIRFRALDGRVLADGPLGAVLREFATVEEVPRPDVPEAVGEGRAVSRAAPLGVLMHRWAALPEAQREAVQLAAEPEGVRGRLIVPDSVSVERADAIAVALGGDGSEPIRWERAPLVPEWVRLRRPASLRRLPTRLSWQRSAQLAEGTFAIALRGRLGRRAQLESGFGRRDTWAFISPAPGLQGWAAGNLMRAHEGCRPSADAVVAALPASTRDRARRTMIASEMRVRRRNAWIPAVAFVATLQPLRRRGTRGRVHLEIHERDPETCAVGRRLMRVGREGAFVGLGVAEDSAAAGGALVALGVDHRLEENRTGTAWSLYEVRRRAQPVWSSEGQIRDVEIAPAGSDALLRYSARQRSYALTRGADGLATRDVGPAPD